MPVRNPNRSGDTKVVINQKPITERGKRRHASRHDNEPHNLAEIYNNNMSVRSSQSHPGDPTRPKLRGPAKRPKMSDLSALGPYSDSQKNWAWLTWNASGRAGDGYGILEAEEAS